MSLPTEIRNEIYGLALTHPQPLSITRHGTHRTKVVHRVSGTRFEKAYRLKYSILTIKHGIRSKTPVKDALPVALLATTKAINDEALPVFLNGNHFIFERASALNEFCCALGPKAKTLAHLTVKEAMSSQNAREQLCILSRLEQPKMVFIIPQTQARDGQQALCASSTWRMIKPVVWRSERPVKPGMSFRPEESIETQRARLDAFRFQVSKFKAMAMDDGGIEIIQNSLKLAERFTELIVECWRTEASATGVRRKREEGGSFVEVHTSKKARLI